VDEPYVLARLEKAGPLTGSDRSAFDADGLGRWFADALDTSDRAEYRRPVAEEDQALLPGRPTRSGSRSDSWAGTEQTPNRAWQTHPYQRWQTTGGFEIIARFSATRLMLR
jgi:hypothetical protein